MTLAETQANNVTPPVASTTPGEGVTSISTSTTAAVVDLGAAGTYPGFFDRYIDIQAVGGTIYILFSSDGLTAIDETVAHGTSVVSGTTKAVPWAIPDGGKETMRLKAGTHRYLHTKAASGTPKLRIRPSSQPAPT